MIGLNKISYHNKRFKSVSNTPNGDVSEQTFFVYYQHEDKLWGEYSGGNIVNGKLIGAVQPNGELHFSYQHQNTEGETKEGKCTSTPTRLADGRIQLLEKWQWTTGDYSRGESVIEELL